jgi:hypothetical protein
MSTSASEQRYSRPDVPRADRPIRIGTMLVTLVEPHRGHEVAYNRWYERDHFYAGCMVGAWQFAGGRFVATADCKELRYPEDSPVTPDRMTGSYVAVYWVLDGQHDEWSQWAVDQVNWLHANDRMFPERDHIHTLLYTFEDELGRDGDHVPAELALDHGFRGLVMVVGEVADGVELPTVTDWFRQRELPAEVAVVASPLPMPADRPSDVPATGGQNRFLHLYFLEEDPREVWADRFALLGAELEASGLGHVVFASPFLATVPGTDRYTDELW